VEGIHISFDMGIGLLFCKRNKRQKNPKILAHFFLCWAQVVEQDYPIDKTLMNLKLLLGYVAVAFALLAQFYPKPWPETWALTAACVAMYAILSSTQQLMLWYYDMDAAAITRPRKVRHK
jgi:hypothetical protein